MHFSMAIQRSSRLFRLPLRARHAGPGAVLLGRRLGRRLGLTRGPVDVGANDLLGRSGSSWQLDIGIELCTWENHGKTMGKW